MPADVSLGPSRPRQSLSWLKQRSTTLWPWYISGSEKHARPGRGLAAEDCALAPPAGLRAPKARLDPQEVNPAAETVSFGSASTASRASHTTSPSQMWRRRAVAAMHQSTRLNPGRDCVCVPLSERPADAVGGLSIRSVDPRKRIALRTRFTPIADVRA